MPEIDIEVECGVCGRIMDVSVNNRNSHLWMATCSRCQEAHGETEKDLSRAEDALQANDTIIGQLKDQISFLTEQLNRRDNDQ